MLAERLQPAFVIVWPSGARTSGSPTRPRARMLLAKRRLGEWEISRGIEI